MRQNCNRVQFLVLIHFDNFITFINTNLVARRKLLEEKKQTSDKAIFNIEIFISFHVMWFFFSKVLDYLIYCIFICHIYARIAANSDFIQINTRPWNALLVIKFKWLVWIAHFDITMNISHIITISVNVQAVDECW